MNLREQGFRFMVAPERTNGNWIHPADVATRCPGWTDCTDMTDAEFDAFMGVPA